MKRIISIIAIVSLISTYAHALDTGAPLTAEQSKELKILGGAFKMINAGGKCETSGKMMFCSAGNLWAIYLVTPNADLKNEGDFAKVTCDSFAGSTKLKTDGMLSSARTKGGSWTLVDCIGKYR